jgi:hypothetical protein
MIKNKIRVISRKIKKTFQSMKDLCGAGKETLTPGLFHGKEAL